MECRRCGACCIALSVSTLNKPAGVRCPHLTPENLCALWGQPERPRVCSAFQPEPVFCGSSFEEALGLMEALENETRSEAGEAGPSSSFFTSGRQAFSADRVLPSGFPGYGDGNA